MKKLTIILIVLFAASIKTNAQIPNSGFETWENYVDEYTGYVYEKPDLWNGSLPNNSVYSFSIVKNPDSYPVGTGQYSMKIQPDIANGVRGVAISNDGADSMVNWIPKPSFAINQRPASLYFYYKCFPFGGDTIIGKVYFYKNGVVIGNPVFGTTQAISSWTAWEVPMTYYTSDVPDSATIFFVTGAYIQHTESIMYVDNLSFDGFVTSISEQTSENTILNIYPNPASDIITLNIENKNNADLTLNIYNATGALVKSEKLIQNQRQFDIGDLSNGIYLVEIKSKEWTGKQKLIIQR
jgi:hypothetical protein